MARAVTDQFAANDPLALGLGTPAQHRQTRGTQSGPQHRIREDRVQAGAKRGRVGGQPMAGAARANPHVQHRRAPCHHGKPADQRKPDEVVPIFAIRQAGDMWPGGHRGRVADQQMSAVGKPVAAQQTLDQIAGRRPQRSSHDCARAGGGDGTGRGA